MQQTIRELREEYTEAAAPQGPLDQPVDQFDRLVDTIDTRRRPGAFTSSEPTPYEKSEMCGSIIEQDRQEAQNRLYGQRQPHYAIKHERYEHRVICYMKATGASNKEIAEVTGFSPVAISNIIRQPWAERLILDEVERLGRAGVQQMLEDAVQDSVQRLIIERDNEDARASERISAANSILDRVLGKPGQTISHKISGNLTNLTDEQLEQIVTEGRSGGTSTATQRS